MEVERKRNHNKRIYIIIFWSGLVASSAFAQPLKISSTKIISDSTTTFTIKIKNRANCRVLIPYYLPCYVSAKKDSITSKNAIEYNFKGYVTNSSERLYDTIDMVKLYCIVGFNGIIMDQLFFAELSKKQTLQIMINYAPSPNNALPRYFTVYAVSPDEASKLIRPEGVDIDLLYAYVSDNKFIHKLKK